MNKKTYKMSQKQTLTKNEAKTAKLIEEIQKLKEQHESSRIAQQKENESLRKELSLLKLEMAKLEDKYSVQSKVTEALSGEVDRLEQYGRRHCVLIKGIPPVRNEDNHALEESVKEILTKDVQLPARHVADLDKAHRVGPVFKDKSGARQQNTIVRFKSHTARYQTYLQRKKVLTSNKKIKITPSLTNRRRKLLLDAQKKFGENPAIQYIFCDIHGDLKLKLHDPYEGNCFHNFNSVSDISWLLHELSQVLVDENSGDENPGDENPSGDE